MQDKKQFVNELAQYHKALNVRQLAGQPHHKNSKDWIAEVSGVLKSLDETDYQSLQKLKKELYLEGVPHRYRLDYARKIDLFVRQKVAEYKRHDFGSPDIKKKKRREICIPIPDIKIPRWITKNLLKIVIGITITIAGGLVLYYVFGIK